MRQLFRHLLVCSHGLSRIHGQSYSRRVSKETINELPSLPKFINSTGKGLEVDIDLAASKMSAVLCELRTKLANVRVGSHPTSFVEAIKIRVDTGAPVALARIGTAIVKDNQTIVLNLFDSKNGKTVASQIQSAGLNLNATLEGSKVIIVIPKVTRELRERLARLAGEQSDFAKKNIREIRGLILKSTKEAIKDLNLKKQVEMATEKLYHTHMDQIDKIVSTKQKEILN